jgi:hypothetical protein
MMERMNWLIPILSLLFLAGAMQVLGRALPAQNIAFIACSLVAAEFVLQVIWGKSGLGQLLFWPAIIIWARIVSRWFLRRNRQNWNYGIWLIVLASAGVALLQFTFAFLAAGWNAAVNQSSVRFVEAGVCLFWLSPWFISKLPQQPHERAQ